MYQQGKVIYLVALVGETPQAETVSPDGHIGEGRLALHHAMRSRDFLICRTRDDGLVRRRVHAAVQEDGQPLRLRYTHQ